MRQKYLSIGLVLTIVIALTFITIAFSIDKFNSFLKTDKPIIRIGYMDWAGFYPLLLAVKNGRFNNKDYSLSLFKAKDNIELNSLVSTGKVDLCFGAFADHIYMKGNDIQIKFIYASDFSKSDVIVADSSIKSLKDFENKKVSITDLNSFSEFFVLTTLQSAGVDIKKLSLKVFDFDNVIAQLDNRNINAGHTWDPETGKALAKGYKVIASSADIKGIVIDGLIATEQILSKNKPHIADILIEINKSQNSIKKLSVEDIDFLASHFQTSAKSIIATIEKGVDFLNLKDNKQLFEEEKNYSLSFWTKKISEFYSSRGQLNKTINTQTILDSSPLNLALQRGEP